MLSGRGTGSRRNENVILPRWLRNQLPVHDLGTFRCGNRVTRGCIKVCDKPSPKPLYFGKGICLTAQILQVQRRSLGNLHLLGGRSATSHLATSSRKRLPSPVLSNRATYERSSIHRRVWVGLVANFLCRSRAGKCPKLNWVTCGSAAGDAIRLQPCTRRRCGSLRSTSGRRCTAARQPATGSKRKTFRTCTALQCVRTGRKRSGLGLA
jgi:hypothetical protein